MTMTKDTFFFIPHTHWEGAVFKTREEYLEIGLPNILRALRLLKVYPNYRFVLDQACYVKPFLERYPEEEALFRKFVLEGRLAIVGGTDVMLDVNMPGGESFIRQVLYGKGYFRKKLGVDVSVGWQLDTFGHHAQMPQLFKLAGYRSFWFFRGVPEWDTPSEFLWEGLDGSQIPAFWLPHGYAITYFSPKSLPEFSDFIKKQFDSLTPFTQRNIRVGLAGADVCEPEEHIPALVEQFNQQPAAPFLLQIAVPADYEALLEASPVERPVLRSELNPIFQGIYSSRIELKQRTREIERLIITAEKLGVLLHWLGLPVDDELLWRAWEPALFNQAHDLMSGVMTDHVYEDTLQSYDYSIRIAREELQTRFQSLISYIDTRGEGIAVVVFNPLGWSRTDIVQLNAGFASDDILDIKLVDPEGRTLPVQIVEAERANNGALLRARIAFVARDVPALGYGLYRLIGLRSMEIPAYEASTQAGALLENEYFSLEIDPDSGAITSLVIKGENWPILSGPGNVVAMEEDRGDLWELYRALDGGSRIAMKERHEPPMAGTARLSTDQTDQPGKVIRGPVFSEFSVAHPFSDKGRFQTTIRLYSDLRRIEISTKILNNDCFVRYRVLFPTTIQQGQNVHEIPFGAIQRPDGIEFPAQNWVDYSDGQKGLALLNRGLPGNNLANGTMMISLMRSTRIVAYEYGGGYEPGMTSDSGFELEKELVFEYALLPHTGDWHKAGVYREGLEFNHPLIASTAAPHAGKLSKLWGFLEISDPNIAVSALKMGESGSTVLRMYEVNGNPVTGAKVKFTAQVSSAEETDLMEDTLHKLEITDNTLQLDMRPFEIKTIKLNFRNP